MRWSLARRLARAVFRDPGVEDSGGAAWLRWRHAQAGARRDDEAFEELDRAVNLDPVVATESQDRFPAGPVPAFRSARVLVCMASVCLARSWLALPFGACLLWWPVRMECAVGRSRYVKPSSRQSTPTTAPP